MNSVEIRAAAPGDEAGILNCLSRAFEPYRAEYSALAYEDTVLNPSSIATRLREMHVLVAVADGEIVGTVSGVCDGVVAHLRGMAVLPEWRGKGVASQLLSSIESWARSRKCSRITLDTTVPLRAAISFYERNGYRRSGKVGEFFGMSLLEYFKVL
jgi:GNAT superfamily N-acetyltransferase